MATHSTRNAGRTDATDAPSKGYKKILLRNPLRNRILGLLESKPGMNIRQLAEALDVNVTAVRFHLQRLERAALVETRSNPQGRETLCFTSDNVSLWDNRCTRVLFGRSSPRQVALYLAQNPHARTREVADDLGVSVHTVRRHLRTLEDQELIQRLRVDRQVTFHAEPVLLDWAQTYGELHEPTAGMKD